MGWVRILDGPSVVRARRDFLITMNHGDDFANYNLEILAGDLRIPVAYDAQMAVPGWNDIGTFELPVGMVGVTGSDAP